MGQTKLTVSKFTDPLPKENDHDQRKRVGT
jgi:hypothetical protein